MSGLVDLHCHLLPSVDDGAKTPEDALAMARALTSLGFDTAAPSPHARAEYASKEVALSRLAQLRDALKAEGVPLSLEVNAENYFLEPGFLEGIGGPEARLVGQGRFVLVEAPYTSPLPMLRDFIFHLKLKGITPLIAHPERCIEFEREGRAAEVVQAGAFLQLDVGALIGRYGGRAKKLARSFLDEGLYAIAATDLHSPVGATQWVEQALKELRDRAGDGALRALFCDNPRRIVTGLPLE